MMVQVTGLGFDKQQRLLTPKDFSPVFNQGGMKIHQSHLLFFVKVRTEGAVSRLGLAVTKKKVKRAHERNRIKRLTREYFRLHQHELGMAVDMVLTVKQSPEPLTNAEIYQQLALAFGVMKRKLGVASAKAV
ncbi:MULTISPECIES: ribonuclease P protein component [unclassified Moraxella]|uniref:ribonuclease P protein component n=1 Tax=unclassified Moraxella TaxID=2685852 RepID=UPI003AF98449